MGIGLQLLADVEKDGSEVGSHGNSSKLIVI